MYSNKNSINGKNDINLIIINYVIIEKCGLVVLNDTQNTLSIKSKIQIQIWTHLGYFS